MQPIITDPVAWFVGLSVGLCVTLVSAAKTAAPIGMPFGSWAGMGRRNHRWGSSGAEDVAMAAIFGFLHMGSHWRHLANTSEPSMCGGDAALCQITLTTC